MTAEQRKPVSLALQGGGAHGAFTWGVLDRLLEDGRIDIAAISGTSAGAMNAVVAAGGLMQAGEDGARAALAAFWKAVSDAARLSPIQRNPIDVLLGNWSLDNSPGFRLFDGLSRVVSPYQFNPLNLNPLRDLLVDQVDFDLVRSCDRMKVFVSATNVETGRVTVFDRRRLTADMVMASACLPYIFQAVEIDGVPYWDGGYVGNPALFPLYPVRETADIVIVQINPVERPGTPDTAREILDRINEISFNSSLLAELRAIDFVHRLIESGQLTDNRYRYLHLHLIEDGAALNPLGASSKLNAEWAFLTHLRDLGRQAAGRWLDAHWRNLGRRSTVDIRAMFQGLRDGQAPPAAAG
ncbi:MAG: patatin-like phospholipase family protein [Alphaproteobacteria bacterium]|nr:MAG: patatin-like phospholipase family protein [Alphaproteobacteria bacterium]